MRAANSVPWQLLAGELAWLVHSGCDEKQVDTPAIFKMGAQRHLGGAPQTASATVWQLV